jgi:hypothetical protein
MLLEFRTGSDDLRGDKDNVNLRVLLRDGSQIIVDNINKSLPWENNSIHTVWVDAGSETPETIAGIRLETNFQGGTGGDNWNLNNLLVFLQDYTGRREVLFHESGDPLIRFTGNVHIKEYPTFPLPTVLFLEFKTGSDDMRGDNDNVNLIVTLSDGNHIRFNNLNDGQRWVGGSTHQVWKQLPGNYTSYDIVNGRLETTFTGGFGGDEWDLNSFFVTSKPPGTGVSQLFYGEGNPLFHFTGGHRIKDYPFRAQ